LFVGGRTRLRLLNIFGRVTSVNNHTIFDCGFAAPVFFVAMMTRLLFAPIPSAAASPRQAIRVFIRAIHDLHRIFQTTFPT
jgi:hypothetical protein